MNVNGNKLFKYFTGFAIFLFLLILPAQAQFLDSIKTSFRYKPKPDFRIETRNSFITNFLARIAAVKAGVSFNKTLKLGIGYNWLFSSIERKTEGASGELKFSYLTPYIEYSFHKTKKWEFSVSALVGAGIAYYDFGTNNNRVQPVLLYEPYMTADYKIFRWLGIGFGAGYRLVFVGNRALDENFNSPIYIIDTKFNPLELLKKKTK